MTRLFSRSPRLLIRVAIYLAVIAVLLIVRGGIDLHRVGRLLRAGASPDTVVTVGGAALAPVLVADLMARYGRRYPRLTIDIRGGGTYDALEDLANGRADVALTCRPPLPAEQALFRDLDGDSLDCQRFALGALLLVVADGSSLEALGGDELRAFLDDRPGPGPDRIFAPAEDLGWWDALLLALGSPPGGAGYPVRPVFLAGEEAVLEAVAADPRAVGLVSALVRPEACAGPDVRCLPVVPAGGGEPVAPEEANVARGDYPLWCHLYACCRGDAGIEAVKLVTHLGSDSGQRQVENAGFLPARQVARPVILSRPSEGRRPAPEDPSP